MKKIIALSLIILSFNLYNVKLFSQIHTLYIKGVVNYIDDQQNVLNNIVSIGDSIFGVIKYNLNAVDNNTSPHIGDYKYSVSPNGIMLRINNYTFETDSNNVDFLVELVNDYNNMDNIVFRSYNNVFTEELPVFSENHISWQLDDNTATALSGINLPGFIDLSLWQQDFGLTIRGENGYSDTSFLIRGPITHVDTVNNISSVGYLHSTDVNIYPNPSSDFVKIKINNNLLGSDYILTDQLGRLVNKGKLESKTTTLDIHQLPKGLYLLQIGKSGNNAFKVLKR